MSIPGVVLGVILLWSGVAKLADRTWPGVAEAWGVGPLLARAVGPFELAIGGSLVTGVLSPWPAVIAAALLLLYTALVAQKVAGRGDAPPCACFGGVSRRPVSWATVVRNVALLGLAVAAAAAG